MLPAPAWNTLFTSSPNPPADSYSCFTTQLDHSPFWEASLFILLSRSQALPCPPPPFPCLPSYPGEPAVTFCHLWSVLSSLTESSPGGEVWPLLAHCLTSYSYWPSSGSRRSRAPHPLAWAEGPLPEVLSLLLGEGGRLSSLGKPK